MLKVLLGGLVYAVGGFFIFSQVRGIIRDYKARKAKKEKKQNEVQTENQIQH